MIKSKIVRLVLVLSALLTIILTGCMPTDVEVGARAPNFQLQDLQGNTVSLNELRGKPIMLNFWATWCPPCRLEMPFIQEIHEEWSDMGLLILAINVGESYSTVSEFMQYYYYSIPVLLDIRRIVTQRYNVGAYPTTFFIDADGIIQDKVIGAFPSKEILQRYVESIVLP